MTCLEVGPVSAGKLKPAAQGFWRLVLEERPYSYGEEYGRLDVVPYAFQYNNARDYSIY